MKDQNCNDGVQSAQNISKIETATVRTKNASAVFEFMNDGLYSRQIGQQYSGNLIS